MEDNVRLMRMDIALDFNPTTEKIDYNSNLAMSPNCAKVIEEQGIEFLLGQNGRLTKFPGNIYDANSATYHEVFLKLIAKCIIHICSNNEDLSHWEIDQFTEWFSDQLRKTIKIL